MQPALHITTTVLPDNRIEINLPPGTAGQQVTVFVVLTDNPEATTSKPNLASSIDLKKMEAALDGQTGPATPRSAVSEILARIRSRPRVNPLEFGLPDSTELIREDRDQFAG